MENYLSEISRNNICIVGFFNRFLIFFKNKTKNYTTLGENFTTGIDNTYLMINPVCISFFFYFYHFIFV